MRYFQNASGVVHGFEPGQEELIAALDNTWLELSTWPPLAQRKDEKRAAIELLRDIACSANVNVFGREWQADKRSQDLLSAAINLAIAGLPLPNSWRDAANNNMPISTIADLLAIAGAIAVQTQTAYEHSWTLKDQVDAAATIAELDAITW